MESDFIELVKKNISNVNTFLGDKEEFDISRRFNKNKKSPIWNEITKNLGNLDNIYMIKVSNRVLSYLSDRRVYSKADAYLVRANFSQNYLLEKEYSLDESDLVGKKYCVIENTGVSVKIEGSTGYTIQKLTYASFIKAFSTILEKPDYIFLAIILYSNEKDKVKNDGIIETLAVDKEKATSYYIDKIGKMLNLNNAADLLKIKKWAQKELKEAIKNNVSIYKSLFTGSDWFDEPYVAHFIYLNKKIKINQLTDFTITTGSGRSKGKFSIEIKPITGNLKDNL